MARQAALTFDKPSAADSSCVIGCSWTRVLRNESGSTAIWSAVVDEPAGVDISVAPATVTLGPGATTTVTIGASLSTAALEAWHFGSVTWQSQSSSAPDAPARRGSPCSAPGSWAPSPWRATTGSR